MQSISPYFSVINAISVKNTLLIRKHIIMDEVETYYLIHYDTIIAIVIWNRGTKRIGVSDMYPIVHVFTQSDERAIKQLCDYLHIDYEDTLKPFVNKHKITKPKLYREVKIKRWTQKDKLEIFNKFVRSRY